MQGYDSVDEEEPGKFELFSESENSLSAIYTWNPSSSFANPYIFSPIRSPTLGVYSASPNFPPPESSPEMLDFRMEISVFL